MPQDQHFMQHALRLAERQLGRTAPNPCVGCVIVNGAQVVGIGVTADGGRPHAETQALGMAGKKVRGATLYVTLEPCAHTGKTPPCADAIIAAGVSRVVCALRDPDARTNGQGLARLREAGIDVTEGVCQTEATRINQGFISVVERERPMVSLKLATSLDSHIATPDGHSQWITNDAARQRGHLLRATHDAVLTGIGTVLADNPRLTCRLSGLEDTPLVRVVLDTQLRLPKTSALLEDIATHPLWVICSTTHGASEKAQTLEHKGAVLLPCTTDTQGHIDIHTALALLAQRGITRVLAECGPTLATSLLRAHCADWLHWFRAPILLGGNARSAITALPELPLNEYLPFTPVQRMVLGNNSYELYQLT